MLAFGTGGVDPVGQTRAPSIQLERSRRAQVPVARRIADVAERVDTLCEQPCRVIETGGIPQAARLAQPGFELPAFARPRLDVAAVPVEAHAPGRRARVTLDFEIAQLDAQAPRQDDGNVGDDTAQQRHTVVIRLV